MRIILTKKDFDKKITIENENDQREPATAATIIKFLKDVASGKSTFKEIVFTDKDITIKTKL